MPADWEEERSVTARIPLAFAALLFATPFAFAAQPIREANARDAFLAELAPGSCSAFEENLPAITALMVANDLRHSDLFDLRRFGAQTADVLRKFEQDITTKGVDATCAEIYRDLGPNGKDLLMMPSAQ